MSENTSRMSDQEWHRFIGNVIGYMELGNMPSVETTVTLINQAIAVREHNDDNDCCCRLHGCEVGNE